MPPFQDQRWHCLQNCNETKIANRAAAPFGSPAGDMGTYDGMMADPTLLAGNIGGGGGSVYGSVVGSTGNGEEEDPYPNPHTTRNSSNSTVFLRVWTAPLLKDEIPSVQLW